MTTIILMVWSMPAVVVHCAELAVVSLQTGNLLLQIIRTINTLLVSTLGNVTITV